jgi:putative tricarboxylic transport membrane protein
MFYNRRRFQNGILVSVFVMLAVFIGGYFSPADAQIAAPKGYPERNVEIIVGWGAGGGTDTYMRAISIQARRLMKNPLVIINMPGASGAKAAEYVQQQPADGYTLWACGSNFPINIALKKTKASADDFQPIIRNQWDVGMIQTSPDKGRFNSIQELIEYAKEHPDSVSIGGTGAASYDEIVLSLFAEEAGITIKYIPYESAGKMHAAVLGGHLDAMFEEPGPTIDLIESGKLKPLLVFMEEKLKEFPDVPSSTELGFDVTLGIWRGLLCKKGTPPEIVKYLHDIFKASAENSIYQAIEKQRYLHLRPGYMGSEDFDKLIKKEVSIYSKVLKNLGHID